MCGRCKYLALSMTEVNCASNVSADHTWRSTSKTDREGIKSTHTHRVTKKREKAKVGNDQGQQSEAEKVKYRVQVLKNNSFRECTSGLEKNLRKRFNVESNITKLDSSCQ